MLTVLRKFRGIIASYKVTKFEQFGGLQKLRAEIELIDGSSLFIRETVLGETRRKYAYHWQERDGKLITRWDNAPDWEVATFPHHKHIGNEDNVEASYERTLEQVMHMIAQRIGEEQD